MRTSKKQIKATVIMPKNQPGRTSDNDEEEPENLGTHKNEQTNPIPCN